MHVKLTHMYIICMYIIGEDVTAYVKHRGGTSTQFNVLLSLSARCSHALALHYFNSPLLNPVRFYLRLC